MICDRFLPYIQMFTWPCTRVTFAAPSHSQTLTNNLSLLYSLTGLWSKTKTFCHLYTKSRWNSPNSCSSQAGITLWKAFLPWDKAAKWGESREAWVGDGDCNWHHASLSTYQRCSDGWWSDIWRPGEVKAAPISDTWDALRKNHNNSLIQCVPAS